MVPYSNSHLLTSPPLGFTVAVKLAVVWVIEEAALVTTVGEFGASVLNVSSEPLLVPPGLVAEILKW